VIFAGAAFVLFGLSALVIDASWYWANTLRVQRAADAAALAGVVSLPGDVNGARTDAASAAVANGYSVTQGCQSDLVTPSSVPGICSNPDPNNNRQLDVQVSAPVNTFFMRLIGITSIQATRSSKAQYVLPVPMGSPQAYYGVYQLDCVPGKTGCPSGTNYNPIPVAPGDPGTAPSNQGFFGAVSSQGGATTNGDMVNPAKDGSVANPEYNASGYSYTVVIPSDGGAVYVFDPTFCAENGGYGEGDHWVGTAASPGMSTFYTLWNTNNLPLAPSRWTITASSGSTFQNEYQSDKSGLYGSDTSGTDCQAGAITTPTTGGYWHNKWWAVGQTTASPTYAQTHLSAGTYELQIATTDPGNTATSVQNMFSIGVVDGTSSPQVYGNGTMANWYNQTGTSIFYLAKIDKTYAGKTLQVNIFDIGDNTANATLKIKSPDGGSQSYVGFTYASASLEGTAGPSGTVTTGSSGLAVTTGCSSSCSKPFDNKLLTLSIPLGSTYGSTGLWQSGWWQFEYNVGSNGDLVTWAVDVSGNPVHLAMP
jgi:Flp pilus assembly protein TadG